MKATLIGRFDFKSGTSKKGTAYAFTPCVFAYKKFRDRYGNEFHGLYAREMNVLPDLIKPEMLIVNREYDISFDEDGQLVACLPIESK